MAPSRNRRPGFSRRAQYSLFLGYVIAVAGSLVGAVLLVLATLDPPAFAALRAAVGEVTTPISSGIAGIGRGIGRDSVVDRRPFRRPPARMPGSARN